MHWRYQLFLLYLIYSIQYDNTHSQSCPTQTWKWNLNAPHRCNITRITPIQLLQKYPKGLPPLYHEPIIIVSSGKQNEFRKRTSSTQILKELGPDFPILLSSSNSFSDDRQWKPFRVYLEEVLQSETSPHEKSNETWYLFGETFSEEWKGLLRHYIVPPCETCVHEESVALSFGIGNAGSGVQWHFHGPGFSEAVHGRKHWVLYPEKPEFDANFTSRHWMEEVYMSMEDAGELPWECTLEEGDMIYFPNGWYHATINLDRYNVFVSAFTTET